MPAYRLYKMDGDGSFSSAEWIEAGDDSEAIAAARAIERTSACELWHGDRLVARIELDARPTDPS